MCKLPKFEEKFDYRYGEGYITTNESIKIHRKLTSGLKVDRALSIASGGEVPLFVLLPISTEVIAVDHCWRPLLLILLRTVMIQEVGFQEYMRLLKDECPRGRFLELYQSAQEKLPETIRAKSVFKRDYYARSDTRTLHASDFSGTYENWKDLKEKEVAFYISNLDRISFVHGDLRDPEGEFDFIYLSNAIEHCSRFREHLSQPQNLGLDILPKLRVGGHVLFTHASSFTPRHNIQEMAETYAKIHFGESVVVLNAEWGMTSAGSWIHVLAQRVK